MGLFSYFITPLFEDQSQVKSKNRDRTLSIHSREDLSEAETEPPRASQPAQFDRSLINGYPQQRDETGEVTQGDVIYQSVEASVHWDQRRAVQQASQPKSIPHVEVPAESSDIGDQEQFTIEDLELLSNLLNQATKQSESKLLHSLADKVDQTLFQSQQCHDDSEDEERILEDTYLDFQFSREDLHRELEFQGHRVIDGEAFDAQSLRDIFDKYLAQNSLLSHGHNLTQSQNSETPTPKRQVIPSIASDKVINLPFYTQDHLVRRSAPALKYDSTHLADDAGPMRDFHERSESHDNAHDVDSYKSQRGDQMRVTHRVSNASQMRHRLSPRVHKVSKVGLDYLIYIDILRHRKVSK